MAIQEIEKKEAQGTVGIKRKINSAAEGLVMDIVQAQQYTKPIPSTVRELTANAVDSQSEKDRAIEILSGKAKPEDYFIKREGDLYADSNWSPDYYNLEHLNQANNEVELIYVDIVGGGGRCDSFIVRDYGVGIGQRRLEGVLEIGFSTKRNRKDALGAFGLGAKVGLATGADYYKLTTVYNGVMYKIQVFNKKLNSLVGKLNMETGKQNIAYTFSDGSVIYGEPTNSKNYTQIEVPALKHHKQDYITAVKTQLLYFKNVKFTIETRDGERVDKSLINFKANTLYNSENLVISDNSPYSKPHVVIVKGGDKGSETGVCYGHIDFKEMELEDMNGDIGIKCPIRQVIEDDDGNELVINEGVDVVPSREAVRWTPATREFLKSQFNVAQHEATHLIEKELQESDFLKWIDACKSITLLSGRRDSAIGRLSRIVDLNTLKPKYSGSKDIVIKFDHLTSLFEGFSLRTSTKYLDRKENKYKVNRENMNGWQSMSMNSLYFKDSNTSRTKDVYLCDQHNGTFITIQPDVDKAIEISVQTLVSQNKLKKDKMEARVAAIIKRRDHILSLMQKSNWFKSYDETEVPEDYLKTLDRLENELEEGEEGSKEKQLTLAEKRKLEQKVVANTLKPRYNSYGDDTAQTYQNSKVEPRIKDVQEYDGQMYYGFQNDLPKLHMAAHILDHHLENVQHGDFYGDHYSIVSISKSNKKYFEEQNHINDFFGKSVLVKDENDKVKGITIMFDNAVTLWNTARKIEPYIKELAFLENFSSFDDEISATYREVKYYVRKNYTNLSDYEGRFGMKEHYKDFVGFLDKIQELQEYVEGEDDTKLIAEKVKDLVLPNDASLPKGTINGIAVDTTMIKKLEELLEYAKPVKDLLNHIPLLTNQGTSISTETSMLLQEYLEFKNM